MTPLFNELQNGDEVEIVRADGQMPPPAWEGLVATGKARAAIRRATRSRSAGNMPGSAGRSSNAPSSVPGRPSRTTSSRPPCPGWPGPRSRTSCPPWVAARCSRATSCGGSTPTTRRSVARASSGTRRAQTGPARTGPARRGKRHPDPRD
jgi:hypothetical protein